MKMKKKKIEWKKWIEHNVVKWYSIKLTITILYTYTIIYYILYIYIINSMHIL